MKVNTLDVECRGDEWWIINHDPEMGPYTTKSDALDDLQGVQRFYKEEFPTIVPTLEDLL